MVEFIWFLGTSFGYFKRLIGTGMKKNFQKSSLSALLFIFFCAVVLTMALRGMAGNPVISDSYSPFYEKAGPFESSGERARFALTYSFLEEGSLHLSLPLAKFSTPDLAVDNGGRYVSLFAPGVSFLIIPGYVIGKYYGFSQLGAYAMISLFALLNIVMLRAIAIRLGVRPFAANFGAMAFAFATPAFSYAVTLSQHHISTFLILTGIYLLILEKREFFSSFVFWFAFALALSVDNPNLFMMFPLAVYFFLKLFTIAKKPESIILTLHFARIFAVSAAVIPLGFFFWFNADSNGSPFKLSGSLERVTVLSDMDISEKSELNISSINETREKNVLGFFNARNLLNGFYVHFISPDRGIINYAPIVFLGTFGLVRLLKKEEIFGNIIIAVIGMNVLLYSMWGDPYGGWAFGSRYLIPTYALLCVGLSIVVSRWRRNIIAMLAVLLLFAYSSKINTLGALTTNVVPPKIEAEAMERLFKQPQKYTYELNRDYLESVGSKSFVYQSFAKGKISARNYFFFITAIIWFGAFILLFHSYIMRFFLAVKAIKVWK